MQEWSNLAALSAHVGEGLVIEIARRNLDRKKMLLEQKVERASALYLQDTSDNVDLGVTSHVAHAMTPHNLAVLKEELAANL